MIKLAGVVVLYNPSSDLIENINTYIDDLDILYCIDNSINVDKNLIHKLNELSKIKYVSLKGNKGLVYALNHAVNLAYNDGFKFLLTMDQDTKFEQGSLTKLKSYAMKSQYSIIAPNIKRVIDFEGNREGEIIEEALFPKENSEVDWVITSGSILSLDDYIKYNGFDLDLFIAQIEQDYCCNLKKNGKKIIMVGDTYIFQQLGNQSQRRILSRIVYPPNYNPERLYYIFRNEVYLRKKWKKYYQKFRVNLLKYIILILLFENLKIQKICFIIKGIKDGLLGNMGQLNI